MTLLTALQEFVAPRPRRRGGVAPQGGGAAVAPIAFKEDELTLIAQIERQYREWAYKNRFNQFFLFEGFLKLASQPDQLLKRILQARPADSSPLMRMQSLIFKGIKLAPTKADLAYGRRAHITSLPKDFNEMSREGKHMLRVATVDERARAFEAFAQPGLAALANQLNISPELDRPHAIPAPPLSHRWQGFVTHASALSPIEVRDYLNAGVTGANGSLGQVHTYMTAIGNGVMSVDGTCHVSAFASIDQFACYLIDEGVLDFEFFGSLLTDEQQLLACALLPTRYTFVGPESEGFHPVTMRDVVALVMTKLDHLSEDDASTRDMKVRCCTRMHAILDDAGSKLADNNFGSSVRHLLAVGLSSRVGLLEAPLQRRLPPLVQGFRCDAVLLKFRRWINERHEQLTAPIGGGAAAVDLVVAPGTMRDQKGASTWVPCFLLLAEMAEFRYPAASANHQIGMLLIIKRELKSAENRPSGRAQALLGFIETCLRPHRLRLDERSKNNYKVSAYQFMSSNSTLAKVDAECAEWMARMGHAILQFQRRITTFQRELTTLVAAAASIRDRSPGR